jgi:hypothetical protein
MHTVKNGMANDFKIFKSNEIKGMPEGGKP